MLWATHLIDEVDDQARIIVLAAGDAPSLREAFARLTEERREGGAPPA